MPRRSPAPAAAAVAPAPAAASAQPGPRPSWSLRRLGPLWLLLAVAVLHGASRVDLGVDTWVALAGGRHVLAHGVTPAEPFSFNSRQPVDTSGDGAAARVAAWLHPRGWINQAWLTQVALAAVERALGPSGLVLLKYATYAAVALLLLLQARRRSAEPVVAIALVGVALLAGRQLFASRAQDASNLLASTLVLILALAVTGSRRAAWTLVPLFAVWGNADGGFAWGLLAVACLLAGSHAARRLRGPLLVVPAATLRTLAAAGASSLAVLIALSPFRLANLTQPVVALVGAEARDWRRTFEWLPLASASTAERGAFAALVAVAAAAAWLALRRAPRAGTLAAAGGRPHGAGAAPCFDLGAATVLALTAVLTVISRRFLPLALLVAAPLLAQWLSVAAAGLAGSPWLGRLRGTWSAHPVRVRAAAAAAWLVAAAIAAGYGAAYRHAFFGTYPLDAARTSLGERTLRAAGQPWDACRFVVDNGVRGRMWTFWDGGGFWAGCQPGEPATGAVAAKVYIDGRAGEAYDGAVYRTYTLIEAGGPAGLRAVLEGREPTVQEAASIRPWVAGQLAQAGITLAHVAIHNDETGIGAALFELPGWQVVYLDGRDAVLVDAGAPEGTELVARLDAGTVTFPSTLAQRLTQAHRAQRQRRPGWARRAVDLAAQAYAIEPTSRAIAIAAAATQDPSCLPDVLALCRRAVATAINDRVRLAQRHGNHQRLTAAAVAAFYLQQEARARNDGEAEARATEQLRWLTQEANALLPATEW